MSIKSALRQIGKKAMELKGAIAVHHTAVDKEGSWDAGEAIKNLGDEPGSAKLKELHAWYDSDKDAEKKGSYKFPHHNVSSDGKVEAANMKACASIVAVLNGSRGGADIPDADRKGVYRHVKAHYSDAELECPDLKSRFTAGKTKLSLEIKEITEQGAFEGMLSPYGNIDDGGDVVEAGAYTKTLKERGFKVPLLWQHRPDKPIGELILSDQKGGLWCKGQLLMDLQTAKEAYLLIKSQIVKGLSIGFEAVKDSIEDGVRHLKEIKLYEGSIVTFPMNQAAMITAVKQLGIKGDFIEELDEMQTLASFWQMQNALSNALYSAVFSSDLDNEGKISACDAVLQQFTDAFSAFLPKYLDALSENYGETWSRGELETKLGAVISSSNADKIKTACGKIKSGHDELIALLEDALSDDGKAGRATLSTKAANEPEPDANHSAAENLSEAEMIEQLRALIPA